MAEVPSFAAAWQGEDALVVRLAGAWTAAGARLVEEEAGGIAREAQGARRVVFELGGVERLDTLGAWVLGRTRHGLDQSGVSTSVRGARPEQRILLDEVAARTVQAPAPVRRGSPMDGVVSFGRVISGAARDLATGTGFLGEIVAAFGRVIAHPSRFRMTTLVHQIDHIALRGLPIIALISFLVGMIVTQQGIFQLQRFGATAFAVNLAGILVLRELGVLLTSIMVAGRSGSAFTAEIGSMKMREEIDALRVMGLDPIEVLVVPRMIALIIALPLLTFLADIAALSGAGVVSLLYGGIGPEIFLTRLQGAISLNTFLVGLIKAPFMALVIGVIACVEGLAVQGSAESLGRQVTASVVKAIFMVIVVDGFFAIFFAAIRF